MPGMRRILALSIGIFAVMSRGVVAEQSGLELVSRDQPQEVRDLRVGERYSGGTRVRSPFVGVSFVVPKNWRASLPAGSIVFLDSAVTAGLGTVHLFTNVTRDSLRAQLSEPQSIEAGFVLHPVGSLQEEGQKLIGHYAAGDDLGVIVAVVGPSRNAVIHQFVGRKTEQGEYRKLVEELTASTRFISERDGPVLRAWYERLTGIVLIPQLDSGITQSAGSTGIHLCSDGRFIRTVRVQPVSGRPVDGEDDGAYHETGTWRIELQGTKAELVLTKSTGGVDKHDVLHQDDQYLLDGRLALASVSNSCL
jgi:hypothetical protein